METRLDKKDTQRIQRMIRSEIQRYIWKFQKSMEEQLDKDMKEDIYG